MRKHFRQVRYAPLAEHAGSYVIQRLCMLYSPQGSVLHASVLVTLLTTSSGQNPPPLAGVNITGYTILVPPSQLSEHSVDRYSHVQFSVSYNRGVVCSKAETLMS